MGLDMYLTKEIYVGGHYDHRGVDGVIEGKIGGTPFKMNLNEVDTITLQVGYWRKANAIHNWIVDNVQGGVDDCKRYYFDKDKILELLEICKNCVKAYEEKDEDYLMEHLPTQSGFFFGDTSYGEYYLEDLMDTINILAGVVDCDDDIYYESSW